MSGDDVAGIIVAVMFSLPVAAMLWIFVLITYQDFIKNGRDK